MSDTGPERTTLRRDRAVDDDRRRQMAASAWILGFIGGPLPAVFAYAVADRDAWNRRFAAGAAVYWTVAWVVILVSVALTAGDRVAGTWPQWIAIGTVLGSLVVVAFAARQAARQAAGRSRLDADRPDGSRGPVTD